MATSKHMTRAERKQQRARKRQRQKTIQTAVIVLGLALVGISAFWLIQGRTATAALEVHSEDIVYDQPMHAIHEMDGAKLNQIPFLPKDGPQPKISIPEDFYNFGTLGKQDVVTYEFPIFNTGDAPLTISRAYTTCGCTTADFTSTVIPPGKVSMMTLVFDAGYHDVGGQTVRRGVIIENNDPRNPQMEIWIQAGIQK